MGGSSSKSDSDSSSNSQYSENVWGGQTGALGSLYNNAQQLFNGTSSGISGNIPNAVNGMNEISNQANPAWQNQLGGGATQNMGLQDQLMSSLNQSMNTPSNMSQINGMIMGGDGNNYADAMKESYMSDANRAQEQMLQTMDARAAASGMSGGSRHGTAIGQGMHDINQNLQQNLARTGFNTFDKDLDRKLSIASQADGNNLQRQQLMSNMIGGQDAAQSNAINQSGQAMQGLQMGQFAPYMVPWDAMGQYANVIGRPTVLGSGTQSGSSNSKSKGLSGGL